MDDNKELHGASGLELRLSQLADRVVGALPSRCFEGSGEGDEGALVSLPVPIRRRPPPPPAKAETVDVSTQTDLEESWDVRIKDAWREALGGLARQWSKVTKQETSCWTGAVALTRGRTQDQTVEEPERPVTQGFYRLQRLTAVGEALEPGEIKVMAMPGDVVKVVEVGKTSDGTRLRGRIVTPSGWITLKDLEKNTVWVDWVRPLTVQTERSASIPEEDPAAEMATSSSSSSSSASAADKKAPGKDKSAADVVADEVKELERRLYKAEVLRAQAEFSTAMLAQKLEALEKDSDVSATAEETGLAQLEGYLSGLHRTSVTFQETHAHIERELEKAKCVIAKRRSSLRNGLGPPMLSSMIFSPRADSGSLGDMVIEYMTDVEGHWEYFVDFVTRSKILDWNGETQGVWGPGHLTLRKNGVFVFGGDAPDKGPGDIRVIKLLVNLKRRHPKRVYILLGNRDLMKMRFMSELSENIEDLTNPWLPPWDARLKPFDAYLAESNLPRTRLSKLKWLLQCTMGCQDTTFGTRKDELAMLHGSATDEDVMRSYVNSVDPAHHDPWMLAFLRLGQIGVIIEDTLFVHGGLSDDSIGFVPGKEERIDDVHQWIEELNAWKDRELECFEASPYFWTDEEGGLTRGGNDLILYGTPMFDGRTVIYHNPFDNGNPTQRTLAVREFLAHGGINRLITGHQPHGQSPTVVRHPSTGLLVVTADTSRSDNLASKVLNPANNRGRAISIIRICGDVLEIEGVLNDGTQHSCCLHSDPKLDELPDALVGRQLTSNAWIKTILRDTAEDEPRVVTALGKGFAVFVQVMTEKQACLQLKGEYGWGGAFVVKLNELHPKMFVKTINSMEMCPHPEDAPGSPARRRQSLIFDRNVFDVNNTYIFSFNGVLLPPNTEKGQSVVQSINKLIREGKRVVFITNDATLSRVSLFNKITNDYGVALMESEHMAGTLKRCSDDKCCKAEMVARCAKESVVTSSCTCAWLLAYHGIKKPFVICYGTGLLEELEAVGITEYFATVNRDGTHKTQFLEPVSVTTIMDIIKQAPEVDAIVVGWDHRLTALTIAVAAQYVRWSEELGASMHIFACSMDIGGIVGRAEHDFEVPRFADRKVRTLGIGTMATAIARCAASEMSPIDVGKPSQIFIEHMRRSRAEGGLGIDFSTAVMVGDNLDTDVRMAHQAGMSSLLVLSGQTSLANLQDSMSRYSIYPTWVVHSFGDTPEDPKEDSSMYVVDPGLRFSVGDDRKQFRAEQGIPDSRVSTLQGEEDQRTIEYITDVEGNWEYMVKFVAQSEILYWAGETRGVWGQGELRLRDHGILVFGGDAPDKGTGDIRIVKIFVDLKRRYPDRVHIILGNRDLVKLRFPSEVAIEEPWMPIWDSRAKSYDDFLEEQRLEPNRVSRVKWLLHCTMGCQDTTFNTRKTELACLYGHASDDDVVNSYLTPVNPNSSDPWMLDFIRLGQIAVIIGDTLFVHAGIQDESAGYVPGDSKIYTSVPEWVHAINTWKDEQLVEYEADPMFRIGEDGELTRGAHELILYGTPYYGKRTVIYYNPFVDGNPVQRSANVRSWLENSQINRLLSGHQPHGQSPTVVRHPSTGLLVVTADTSRSNANGSKVLNPANNRGAALSVVRIIGDCLFIQGETNDGQQHGCRLHVDPNKDTMPDALVGRQLTDNSWVKTVMRGGDDLKVTIARGKGFKVEVSDISIQQACLRLKSEYGWGGAFAIQLQDIDADEMYIAETTVEACLPEEEVLSPRRYQRSYTFDQKLFDEAETYLFSYNGVMLDPATDQGKKIVDNVNNIIRKGKRVIFISNDSTMSRKSFFKKITNKFGVQLHESVESMIRRPSASKRQNGYHPSSSICLSQESVVTSAFTCAWFLKSAGIKKPFVVGYGNGLIDEFAVEGIDDYFATVDENGQQKPEFLQPVTAQNILDIVKQAPDIDAIVVGWDHQLTALTIAVAAQYLRWSLELGKPIPIIACSMDLGGILGRTPEDFDIPHFAGRKVRTLGIGTMSHAICSCVRPPRQAINVGKPSQLFIEHLRRPMDEGGLEVDFTKAVMIGDNMNTDVELANRAGMKSVLVLSGVTSAEDFDRAVRMSRMLMPDSQTPKSFPTWVIDSFASVETSKD